MATRLDLTSGRLVNDAFLVPKPGDGGAPWYTTGSWDIDAVGYLAQVESADGQALEAGVRTAINDFVAGCKTDGIWGAINAACILAGARTLSGALVPLKGAAPTNNNFVSDDYNRETGLLGDGSTTYLNSNRAGGADPRDSSHISVWVSSNTSNNATLIGSGVAETGATSIVDSPLNTSYYLRSRHSASHQFVDAGNRTGLVGISRAGSSSYNFRLSGGDNTISVASQADGLADNFYVFGRNNAGTLNQPAAARLAFYSIGTSLTLSSLDSRLATLVSAIAAAIP